jgi:hypothetical protein
MTVLISEELVSCEAIEAAELNGIEGGMSMPQLPIIPIHTSTGPTCPLPPIKLPMPF